MACPINPLDCVKDVASSAASDVFSSIAHDFAKAADSTINWLWAQMSTATAIRLGGTAFDQLLAVAGLVAIVIAIGIFVAQMAVSALRRDPTGIGRAAVGLVVMGLGGGAAIAVTELLLQAVDAVSAGVLQVTTGQSVQQMGSSILAVGSISAFTNNPAALILVSLFTLAAVVMVWLALTIRKLLVIVAAVLSPFAFAGGLADFSRSWVRRWVELVAALIFSKLILMFVFVTGLFVLIRGVGSTGSGATQGVTQTVCGILILALAGLAPWVAIKMAHFAGAHLEALHYQVAGATAGASQVRSMAHPVGAAFTAGGPAAAGAALGSSTKPWSAQTPGNTPGAQPSPSPEGAPSGPATEPGPSTNGHTAANPNPAPPSNAGATNHAPTSTGGAANNGPTSNGTGATPPRQTSGWSDVDTSTPAASGPTQATADQLTADSPRSGWWDTPTSAPPPNRPINPKGDQLP